MAEPLVFDFSSGVGQFAAAGVKNIKRPREFAYYSLDQQRNTLPLSIASLRYSYPCMSSAPFEFGDSGSVRHAEPINQISLRNGFNKFEKFDDSQDEHLDAILDTIEVYENQNATKIKPDFLMFRGMMTKILTIPYEHANDTAFEMNATLFEDTIFIEQNKAHKLAEEQARARRDHSRGNHSRKQDQAYDKPTPEEMQYWGYKFETLCSLDRPYVDSTRRDVETRRHAIVNNAEQYCSIVNTGIGDLTIVLAGEVDAVRGIKPDNTEAAIPWVEFKTNRALETDNDYRFWSEKLLRVWSQSYLLGVPLVVIGFRSQSGQLLSIEEHETRTLPSLAKNIAMRQGRSNAWDGSVCINFAETLLRFLRNHITEPGVVWRIQRRPSERSIRLFPVSDIKPDTIITSSFATHRREVKSQT